MPIVSERSQSGRREALAAAGAAFSRGRAVAHASLDYKQNYEQNARCTGGAKVPGRPRRRPGRPVLYWLARCLRSEEHTSELQSRLHLVCRLLLEKKKTHI